ncbi:MAG: allose kinase [Christensenellales bacterium]
MKGFEGQVLAMDVGGTRTRMGLVDAGGRLHAYRILSTSDWAGSEPVESLVRLIADFLAKEGPKGLAAISLGFPSAVDKSRRTLLSTPAIPALDGVPLAGLLEDRFPCPVLLDRDVVMLYAHAAHALALPAAGMTLGFFIGTGIGNIIVQDGKPFTGSNGIAGELGHVPFGALSGRCGCGGRGCAELYTAGRALQGIHARYFAEEPIESLFLEHLDSAPLRLYLKRLAALLASEITILDPDRVLMGGGVVHMPGFPLEALKALTGERLRSPAPALTILWHLAPDAQQAGVIGAGLRGWQALGLMENPQQ